MKKSGKKSSNIFKSSFKKLKGKVRGSPAMQDVRGRKDRKRV